MKNKRILIVDDDQLVLSLVKDIAELVCPTCQVLAAANASEALYHLRMLEGEQTLDLLLTDYNMPTWNGLDLAYFIRQIWPETRIVLMTGNSHNADLQRGLKVVKIDALVEKPFGPNELGAIILTELEASPKEIADSCWVN